MRRFIVGWKQLGMQHRWSAHIVNFAHDFVICCKGRAEDAMEAMRSMMERLKLTVNDDKTHQCRLPQESSDFLGYTFGRCYSRQSGRAYIGTRVAKKSIKRMVETISRETERRMLFRQAGSRWPHHCRSRAPKTPCDRRILHVYRCVPACNGWFHYSVRQVVRKTCPQPGRNCLRENEITISEASFALLREACPRLFWSIPYCWRRRVKWNQMRLFATDQKT